jgi:hypothetical protein
MTIPFINSLESEWIKKKRSLSSWLIVIGALFTPTIIVIARLARPETLEKIYQADTFWIDHWKNCWESMAIFLLPIGLMLAASLITQLEYKNNTWKQLHTSPLRYTTIYFSKLTILIVMMLQFFVLFNIMIFLSAMIPPLIYTQVPFPSAPMNISFMLRENTYYFMDCLPIVSLQYLISLNYKNFLVPLGVGFLLWIISIATITWDYGFCVPYIYTMFNFLKANATRKIHFPTFSFHFIALGYFVIFTTVGYIFYVRKKIKG